MEVIGVQTNVKIDYGVTDWEILQHKNGFADFKVGGSYSISDAVSPDKACQAQIMLRVYEESTDEPVTPWLLAERRTTDWNCRLHIPCGGLYRLVTVIRFDKTFWVERGVMGQAVHHFGVGDVYVIAGQSNAAGTGRGVFTENPELGVHTLRNCKKWDLATNPMYDERGFHGPCIAFAKKLKSKLNYPIGLVPCAFGGSSLQSWIKSEGGQWYNEMITTLKSHNIHVKGVIWYQGESDTNTIKAAENYLKRFEQFVLNLREDLMNEKLPIITFQLNRHCNDFENNKEHDIAFDMIREAQRQAAKTIENVYIVPTIDAGKMTDGIHNSKASNVMLGERAAQLILNKVYDIGIDFSAPDIIYAKFISETDIELKFNNVADCLMTFHVGAYRLPIMIEDNNGEISIEDYTLNRDKINLRIARKAVGTTKIKCQYGTNPKELIQDIGNQLPVLCFSDVEIK